MSLTMGSGTRVMLLLRSKQEENRKKHMCNKYSTCPILYGGCNMHVKYDVHFIERRGHIASDCASP